MHLSAHNVAAIESDVSGTFPLPPPAAAIELPKPRYLPDSGTRRDGLYIGNAAQDREVHRVSSKRVQNRSDADSRSSIAERRRESNRIVIPTPCKSSPPPRGAAASHGSAHTRSFSQSWNSSGVGGLRSGSLRCLRSFPRSFERAKAVRSASRVNSGIPRTPYLFPLPCRRSPRRTMWRGMPRHGGGFQVHHVAKGGVRRTACRLVFPSAPPSVLVRSSRTRFRRPWGTR